MTPDRREMVLSAFGHVREPWSATRLVNGRAHLEKKRVRRRVARASALSVSALAVALLIASRMPDPARPESASRVATPVEISPAGELTDGALLLSDGSFAEPLAPDTALAVEADADDHVRIALIDGAARFDVVRNAARTFVVGVRGLRVEVIGTRFEVEVDGSRCHVRVLRGHVRVTWARGRRDLLTGQSGLFPLEDGGVPLPPPTQVVELDEPVEIGPPVTHEATRRVPDAPEPDPAAASPSDWRQLARSGDYDSAFRASREQSVGTSIDDLWLAADASRHSGHPREAVAYLEQALSHYPSDGRVHLAAFTLGRLHLQLGQPRQAALDFAQVERLDRRGVLVEQALAREVEAWTRAGEVSRARDRASAYLRRFPEGTYAERVRRFSTPP